MTTTVQQAEATLAAAQAALEAARIAEAEQERKALRLPIDKLAVNPSEAGRLLGVSRPTMYRLISKGKIKAKRLGKRKTLIAISELRRFLGEKS